VFFNLSGFYTEILFQYK